MTKAIITTIAGLIGRSLAWLALFFYAKREGKKEAVTEHMEALKDAAQKEAQDWSNRSRTYDDFADRLRKAASKRKDNP